MASSLPPCSARQRPSAQLCKSVLEAADTPRHALALSQQALQYKHLFPGALLSSIHRASPTRTWPPKHTSVSPPPRPQCRHAILSRNVFVRCCSLLPAQDVKSRSWLVRTYYKNRIFMGYCCVCCEVLYLVVSGAGRERAGCGEGGSAGRQRGRAREVPRAMLVRASGPWRLWTLRSACFCGAVRYT